MALTNRVERPTPPELKQANDLLVRKIYDEAHVQYLRVIGSILGKDFAIPLPQDQDGGVTCEKYMRLTMDNRINLMACCNGVAKCLAERQKLAEVDVTVATRVTEGLKWSRTRRHWTGMKKSTLLTKTHA